MKSFENLLFAENNSIILHGFAVRLTKGEYSLLSAIADAYPRYFSVSSAPLLGITEKSIPVMINSINKKAAYISGRQLVISSRKTGYTINEFM